MDLFKNINLSKAIHESIDDLFNHNHTFDLLPHAQKTIPTTHTNLVESNSFHLSLAPMLNVLIAILGFTVIAYIYYLLLKLIPKILSLIHNLKQPYIILEIKPLRDTKLSAGSTKQLFEFIHGLINQKTAKDRFFQRKKSCSLEIISSKNLGIRYLLRIYSKDEDIIRKKLISYFSQISINKTDDYFPSKFEKLQGFYKIVELKLLEHFAAPLKKKDDLEEDDPISYITGNMTKLEKDEMVAVQLIVSPVDLYSHKSVIKKKAQINNWINLGYDLSYYLKKKDHSFIFNLLFFLLKASLFITMAIFGFILDLVEGFVFHKFSHHAEASFEIFTSKPKYKKTDNPYHKELEMQSKSKISSELYETTLRLFVLSDKKVSVSDKIRGLSLAFKQFENNPHQKLVTGISFSNFGVFSNKRLEKLKFWILKNRLDFFSQTSILSSFEVGDIYHFPYTSTTKTENISKTFAKELPAPLSFKQDRKYDVILGKNTYAGVSTLIGLTDDERARHKLVLGGSGGGKTTLILYEIIQDIKAGRGVGVIDPHGDLADMLRWFIPENRAGDFVWVDPDDLDHPVVINMMELKPGLTGNALLKDKQFVCESIIDMFRKIFNDEGAWTTNTHRIEHVLRKAIYTCFELEDTTIFTILDLFENPTFRKGVVNNLKDPNLKGFWKNYFGRAGDYQQVKMMGGIVSRISAFIDSPSARKMMEKSKSTIDFDQIMDEKKILICNLSRGKLTGPVSELMGMMILNKIQLATLRRARVEEEKRTPFYLYVDEFQYYATRAFVDMLSEGRKYGLRITIVQQTTAQQYDQHLTNIILSNVGTVIFFRNSSSMDEEIFLQIFYPYVEKGALNYLSAYHFYIKISAINPEEPFSGETIVVKAQKDHKKLARLLEESQKQYTYIFQEPKEELKPTPPESNGQVKLDTQILKDSQVIIDPNKHTNSNLEKYI